MALLMVFYIQMSPRARKPSECSLHASPRPLGRAARNTLRRTLRLQCSGPCGNEGGDLRVISVDLG